MSTKTPNFTKPLALVVLLCGLGGFAYWLEYSKKPKTEKAEADAKKVFALKDSPVARFELRGASTKPENATKPPLAVVLTCESLKEKLCKTEDASKWTLAEPLHAKADDTTVNSLLKNLGTMTTSETIDLSTETPEKRGQLLKDYGVDAAARANPRTRKITLAIEGSTRISVYFGAKHPISDGVFAVMESGEAVNENRVLVVPEWQISVFDQKTSYFRDRSLFALNEKEVSGFTLALSKKVSGKLEAKRTADEKGWQLKLGATEVEGDSDTIDGILSGVAHTIAKDIATKAELTGAKNTYDLSLRTKSGEKRLRLYEKKKDAKTPATVYAVVEGSDPVFELDPYSAERIEKTFDEMRVGKLINVADRYSITTIQITNHGAESFTQIAQKEKDGHWKIGATETGRGKVENILDRLSSKIVISYKGAAPSGDVLKMKFLKSEDQKLPPIAEIEFWSSKGRLYARNLQTPKREVVELAADFLSTLPWTAKTLFDPQGEKK